MPMLCDVNLLLALVTDRHAHHPGAVRWFDTLAVGDALELIQIDVPRATRVGNSIIQSGVRVAKAQDRDQLYEAIVELKKR